MTDQKTGKHITIKWQTDTEEGATVEDLLEICGKQLQASTPGSSSYDSSAIRHIICALSALDEQTRDREIRGVEEEA